MRWNSGAKIRTVADGKRWVIEYAIPLKSLRYGHYDAKDEDGRPLVAIPPSGRHGLPRLVFARHRRQRGVLQRLRRTRLEHDQDEAGLRLEGAGLPDQRAGPDHGRQDRRADDGQEPQHPVGDRAARVPRRERRRGIDLFELPVAGDPGRAARAAAGRDAQAAAAAATARA